MEDEEPTDRTKRAREAPENRVGKEVPPKRMRKLFADLKEAVKKSGKVKLSAREELNTILFANDPRPRDNQGQFTDANGNMINPNSIAIAYQKPQQQPQPQQKDKPKEEESKAKKLISKLNKKESDMKQNNMSAREELNQIMLGIGASIGGMLAAPPSLIKVGGLAGPNVITKKYLRKAARGPQSLAEPAPKGLLVSGGNLGRSGEALFSAREELDTIRFGIKPFFKAKYPGGPMKKYTGADAEFMARMQRKDMFPEMLRENAMKREAAAQAAAAARMDLRRASR